MVSSSRLTITRPTQRMLTDIGYCLRDADVQEIKAMGGGNPVKALTRSANASEMAWVALWDGVPTVAFGVARESWLPNVGNPWMLATDGILAMKTTFVRGSIEFVELMHKPFDILRNYVDVRNKVSVQWLKWLGFTLLPPKPYGPRKKLFHEFYKGD